MRGVDLPLSLLASSEATPAPRSSVQGSARLHGKSLRKSGLADHDALLYLRYSLHSVACFWAAIRTKVFVFLHLHVSLYAIEAYTIESGVVLLFTVNHAYSPCMARGWTSLKVGTQLNLAF